MMMVANLAIDNINDSLPWREDGVYALDCSITDKRGR